MRLKTLGDLFHYFHRRGIKHLLASLGPQQAAMAFNVTGGGTGTDAVAFTDQSMGGQTCPNMADTDYVVLFGNTITAANGYLSVATKATTGFSILGLALNEVVGIAVIGRADGMSVEQ